jgi:hypothetical protein
MRFGTKRARGDIRNQSYMYTANRCFTHKGGEGAVGGELVQWGRGRVVEASGASKREGESNGVKAEELPTVDDSGKVIADAR